jgi:hypothetical protein
MIRLGSNLFQMRDICDHDILFSRLKLLVIAAKAYLENHDFGSWRLRSMVRNTRHLSTFMSNWHDSLMNFDTSPKQSRRIHMDHIFHQRVKLLSIMLKSFAEGNPMGQHRRAALKNNVDYISETLDAMRCVSRPNLHVVR